MTGLGVREAVCHNDNYARLGHTGDGGSVVSIDAATHGMHDHCEPLMAHLDLDLRLLALLLRPCK